MKFKVGDKVKFVKNRPNCFNNRDYLLGQIFTIEDSGPYPCTWKMKENNRYFFDEKELELVENTKVDITIDVTDKAVEDAIAKYKKKKAEWTEDELAQAREIFKDLIAEWILDENKDAIFYVNEENKRVTFADTIFSFDAISATPENPDEFNPIIGKVVCLCKALKKPIPEFILNKNT